MHRIAKNAPNSRSQCVQEEHHRDQFIPISSSMHSIDSRGPCSVHIRFQPILVLPIIILAMSMDAACATRIQDGNNFSMSIGENPPTRVCVLFPQSARDPATCAGLTFGEQPSSDSEHRNVAIGRIWFEDNGTASEASFAVSFLPELDSAEPDNSKVLGLTREFEHNYTRDESKMNVRRTASGEIRVVSGLKVVRVILDVTSLSNDKRQKIRHGVFYFCWVEEGVYIFSISTDGDHASAANAIADSSVLSLQVSRPAGSSPLTRLQLELAICAWFIFVFFVAIHLLWVFLRRKRRFASLTSLVPRATGRAFLGIAEFDVSTPARLRKSIRSGARALNWIGLYSAFIFPIHFRSRLGYIGLVCGLFLLWLSLALSKRLRSGSRLSAALASLWCVLWSGFTFFQLLLEMKTKPDFYGILGVMMFILLIGFLIRGLIAFHALAAFQKNKKNADNPLAYHPWEYGMYITTHPRFLNSKSIRAHFYLLLAPLPFLLLVGIRVIYHYDIGSLLALFLQAIVGPCIWLGGTAGGILLYRRARAQAMVPGKELVNADSRSIVLYLRSFHDDKIKLWARAADGRILPERLVKISFEELVTDHLWGFGPVLAMGNPEISKQKMPLGAVRNYLEDVSWQDATTQLMEQASMIVAVAAASPGLAWELGRVVERGFICKFVLVIPPLKREELETRWQFLSESALGTNLPLQIDLSRARAVVFPSGQPIVITGNKRNEWTYEAVLDEAVLLIAAVTT